MANVHFNPTRSHAPAQIIPISEAVGRVEHGPVYEAVSPEILTEGVAAIRLMVARESATDYPNQEAIERASWLVDDLVALPKLDHISMDPERAVVFSAGITGVSTLVALALQESNPDLGIIADACWLTADLGTLVERQIERDIRA